MNKHVMDSDIGATRLDTMPNGKLGAPVERYEGLLKVTGQAPYAEDQHQNGDLAHGILVTAPTGCGTIESVDGSAALREPEVLTVLTGDQLPRASSQPMGEGPQASGAAVHHHGQPIALVVAETLEAARHAGTLIVASIRATPGRYSLAESMRDAPIAQDGILPGDLERGDFESAFAAAEVTIDRTFTTASQHSSAMEPQASIAEWHGETLTVWSACQLVETNVEQIASALGISARHIRLISPYVGGGFGNKLGISADSVMAARAARELRRPVKVVLTRPDVFQTTSRRSETIQRLRLGADGHGRISAIAHETWCANSPGNTFFEPAGISTTFVYGGEHRRVRHRLAETDVLMTAAVRAPGEAVGMLALECAMDELAEKLQLDPIELRRRNEPDRDPQTGRPFSARSLIACMEDGARRFGWHESRNDGPRRREGDWLIGYGMAAASRANTLMAASAEVTLSASGRATVRTAMTDIGTGTYTVLQQITAEMLGLSLTDVDVVLGDSALPASPGSGGSWGANSAGSAVYMACESIIDELARRLSVEPGRLRLNERQVIADNRRRALIDVLAGEAIVKQGRIEPGATSRCHTQASYGAHFCELAVHAITGETRVRRLLTVAAAGRILNPRTARSQCHGGQIWGIGSALMEGLQIDPRNGLILNHDLAQYHLPVHADVPSLEVVFLSEHDGLASPLAGKGIGELALSGVGAAIGNAIHDACGVRMHDYPVTPDKLIASLPSLHEFCAGPT
ncbi:MAG: xanthine dehydrogenase family protein molybdopterin-binding subunit [Gammaproteobacteria bacterium]|nr:xanthine dehydrogenase family protein molybdopterin-binding subunit [Gammaproteobacteria bacterium]